MELITSTLRPDTGNRQASGRAHTEIRRPLRSPYEVDTLNVAPGERYNVLVNADAVGVWAFHCHIFAHSESETGMRGMVTAVVVQ